MVSDDDETHANVVPQGDAANFDPAEYMQYVEDFELSEEHQAFAESVRRFAQDRLAPGALERVMGGL